MKPIEQICQIVCEEFGVSYGELLSKRRAYGVAEARHAAICLSLPYVDWQEIATHFKRERTLVLYHAPRRIRNAAEVYPAFKKKLETLKTKLANHPLSETNP